MLDIVDNLRTYRVCDYSKLSSETLCCIFLYIHFTRALSNLYESYAEFCLNGVERFICQTFCSTHQFGRIFLLDTPHVLQSENEKKKIFVSLCVFVDGVRVC